MRFACEGCSARYMISDDKVGPAGVKVRCKKCGHVTHVRRAPVEAAAPVPAARPAGAQAAPVAFPAPSAAPAFAPPGEWWVAVGDQPVGPLAISEVRRRWDSGEIAAESLCWHPDLSDWAPISAVPALREELAPRRDVAPPPPAPPAPPPPPEDLVPPPSAPPEPEAGLAGSPAPTAPAEPAPPAAPATEPVAPLPMAPLERTGEHRLERAGAAGPRKGPAAEKSGPRTFTVVLVVLLLVAIAGAVAARFLLK